MTEKKLPTGTVFAGALFVSGTCIGGGMLGIPLMTGLAGIWPCLIINFLCWLFMLCTGLLFLEVTLWMPDGSNLVSMAQRFLGPVAKIIAWLTFLFLYYSLLVAYLSGTVPIFETLFQGKLNSYLLHALCVVLFGGLLFLGARMISRVNTILMFGLLISFVIVFSKGSLSVTLPFPAHRAWPFMFLSVPILFSAYGFHNIIPSITTYLKRDAKKLRRAIFIGTLIPFVIYGLWQCMIIGSISTDQLQLALDKGLPVTEVMKFLAYSPWVYHTLSCFSFFALSTSLIGVAFSMVDFLGDGLKIKKYGWRRIVLCALVLVPPAVLSVNISGIFITALTYAGGFGESILNGIFPVLMSWKGRYYHKLPAHVPLPGGRFTLSVLLLISVSIIVFEAFSI